MKAIMMTILILTAFISSCKKDSEPNPIKGYYDSMHFVREGGGEINFVVNYYASNDSSKVKVVISNYDSRDTTLQIVIDRDADNSHVFSLFNKAMNNQMQINGDFKQSTALTGTWSRVYFVTNNNETEVTNTKLRNTLLEFEQLVRDRIQ